MLRYRSNPLFERYALPILLTAVFFLFPFRSSSIVGEALGVPFLVAYTVLLPGAALTRLLRLRPVNAADAAALWTVHGVAVLLACTFAWALLRIPIAGFSAIIALATTSLHIAAPPLDDTRIHPSARRENRAERALLIVMIGLAIVFGCAVYIAGAPLDFGKDTYDYISYANEVAVTGDAFPTTAFYRDPGLDGADLRKGLLHAVFGFYHGWLGLDTIRIFAMLAALMLIAATLVVYSAALRMFDDRAVAALSAIFFLLCYDGGPGDSLQRAWFYPSRFGMVALLAYTASALEFMRRPRARGLVLMALYAFTAAAIHIQYAVFAGFVAGVILLWKVCSPREHWSDHVRGALQVGAAGFFGFLPYAMFRYVTAYQTNELHTQVQAAVYVFGDAFIANPVHTWQSVGFLGAAAIVGILSAWSLRRRHAAAGFLCAAMLSALLIQYNPFVLPTVYKVMTYLVYRLDKAAPWFMLPAFITVVVFRRIDTPTRRGFTRVTLLLTLAAVIAGLLSFPGLGAIRPAALAWERENSYRRWEDGLRDLSERLPAGSVIASDPVTSYTISALTAHYVLCTLDQHAPPNDRMSRQRMSAARDIVGPLTPHDVRIALVDTLGVTHILINGNLPGDMLLDYWTMAPSVAMQSRARLDSRPDLYERIELRDSLTVYTTAGRGARPFTPRAW